MIRTTEPIKNYRLEAALAYAARGWLVFPCHHPVRPATDGRPAKCSCGDRDGSCTRVGKHPRTPNGLHDATSDPEMVRAWWDRWPAANIGIATGCGSGLYVIDIDVPKAGGETWQELAASYGDAPPTPTVETGGGGFHLFLAHPGVAVTLKNTAERLGPGVDTRGDGGYVVAPPSLHESGRHYEWHPELTPDRIPLADIPPWVSGLLTPPAPKPSTRAAAGTTPRDDSGQFWLGKALAKANEGNRNDTGFWLAAQLRDAGLGHREAEVFMYQYVERCPRGSTPYGDAEMLASLAQAYAVPAREPARGASRTYPDRAPAVSVEPTRIIAPAPAAETISGAAAEVGDYYERIIRGEIYPVPFDGPILTRLTNALCPGTSTLIIGDPGVGKTYLIIQHLLFWQQQGVPAVAFFIEKRRRFYSMRLLAHLEGDPKFLDLIWVREHPAETRDALAKHRETIDGVGRMMWSSQGARVTLDTLLAWVRQMFSAGQRVVVIDPITAVDAGVERWTKDDDFVLAAEEIAEQHDGSIIYVGHAKKGTRPHEPTGHDAGGGAAWYRFADTMIWMHVPKRPREVRVQTPCGPTNMTPKLFFQIPKARCGPGSGQEMAYIFGAGLKFVEQGLVIEDV